MPEPSQRLILFAKRPRPGGVKTRLVPPLSHAQALALYCAFLEDQIAFVAGFARTCAVELCLDSPSTPTESLPELPAGVRIGKQGTGSLGRRMLRAFERSHRDGHAATVIIGADSPTLPAARVDQAFRRLAGGADAVVAPAEDGGYVLIGMRAPRTALFADIPWGTADVFEITLRRADASGARLEPIDGWYDVDDAAGLRRLRDELAFEGVAERASATSDALAALARGVI